MIKTIALGGRPAMAVGDRDGDIFVALPQQNQVALIDARDLKLRRRWSTEPGRGPYALSFDARRRRLFVGCRNRLALVMDSGNGKVLASLPIGDGVGGSAFDSSSGFAFFSCADGTLSVLHEDGPAQFHLVENLSTAKGAQRMALDRETHRLFLPSALPGDVALTVSAQAAAAPPASMRLLVYGND